MMTIIIFKAGKNHANCISNEKYKSVIGKVEELKLKLAQSINLCATKDKEIERQKEMISELTKTNLRFESKTFSKIDLIGGIF